MRTWLCVVVAAPTLLAAGAAFAERSSEQRWVVFQDGEVPHIQVSGDRYVRGDLELEIRFKDANPLCFAYSVDGHRLDAPRRPPEPSRFDQMLSAAEGSQQFATVDAARRAVEARLRELSTLSQEAADKASLEQVWDACLWANPPSRVLPLQQRHISSVAAMLQTRLGQNGAWTQIFVSSIDTLASVRRFAASLAQQGSESAEFTEQQRRRLAGAAEGLERYLIATLALVHRTQADLQEVQTRLASAPAATTRHIAANREVVIEVERTRLDRGKTDAALDTVQVRSEAYRTLPRILFDLGVGPSLTFRNTEEYSLGQKGNDRIPNVVRTEDSANVDGVISLSMYVWGARYLDDRIFDASHLLPRPMVGLSMRQPFSSLYFGGQIDPIQFVDLSFGARVYSTTHLIAPEQGRAAYVDGNGEPVPPVTREGVTTQLFVSLTASTDLFQRWIQRSF